MKQSKGIPVQGVSTLTLTLTRPSGSPLCKPLPPHLPDTAGVGHSTGQRAAAIARVVWIRMPVAEFITSTAGKLQDKEKS